MLRAVLVIFLLLLLLGTVPVWTYSTNWGYYPFGFSTLFLIIILIALFGRGRPV